LLLFALGSITSIFISAKITFATVRNPDFNQEITACNRLEKCKNRLENSLAPRSHDGNNIDVIKNYLPLR